MKTVYLDNAATSYPKAGGVGARMMHCVDNIGASIGRSAYDAAEEAAEVALSLRERLGALFRYEDVSHIVITSGATAALNMVIKGSLKPGDHCIVDAAAHNAAMRPLSQMAARGVEVAYIPVDEEGVVCADALTPLIKGNTRLIILTHASNVTGGIAPLCEIADIARAHGVPLLVDAAQTAGHLDIDFTGLGLGALAIPAHKGLLGPPGIGALLLDRDFAKKLDPLFTGGTGSASESEEQPLFMPDRFEAGTQNMPGIFGFEHALAFIMERGTAALRAHDMALAARFLDGVRGLTGVRVLGPKDTENRVAVVSLDFTGRDNAMIADTLAREYGILTRTGLHCAPAAHKAAGSFPMGAVRFSFGFKNTLEETAYTISAIEKTLGNR